MKAGPRGRVHAVRGNVAIKLKLAIWKAKIIARIADASLAYVHNTCLTERHLVSCDWQVAFRQ